MKKLSKILTLFTLFISVGFPAFAITDEQIENYFYKKERSFYIFFTLDYDEIKFYYDEYSKYYEWFNFCEAGKRDVIDNIYSRWVKVEAQEGAKDRDGNPVKAGTVGWCYGGYLD